MTPAQELAAAADKLDQQAPGACQCERSKRDAQLAVVLREASYTIENNVNILLPRGLPAVPVSGGLLDLARLINGSAS